jgi:transcriptional regulator
MLTEKEIEVLNLKSKGLNQVEIANQLKISQPAVSSFYKNALKKITDAHATLELVREMKLKK